MKIVHSVKRWAVILGVFALVGCQAEEPEIEDPVGTDAATLEENKRLVSRVYEEAYNGGDIAVIDELLSPDYVNHQVFPGLPDTREGLKEVIGAMRTAFPDLNISIHRVLAEGDRVSVAATIEGTHEGPMMGMPPSGNAVSFETMDEFRLVDGLQVEHWGVTDQLTMLTQMGILPSGEEH